MYDTINMGKYSLLVHFEIFYSLVINKYNVFISLLRKIQHYTASEKEFRKLFSNHSIKLFSKFNYAVYKYSALK